MLESRLRCKKWYYILYIIENISTKLLQNNFVFRRTFFHLCFCWLFQSKWNHSKNYMREVFAYSICLVYFQTVFCHKLKYLPFMPLAFSHLSTMLVLFQFCNISAFAELKSWLWKKAYLGWQCARYLHNYPLSNCSDVLGCCNWQKTWLYTFHCSIHYLLFKKKKNLEFGSNSYYLCSIFFPIIIIIFSWNIETNKAHCIAL